MEARSPRPPEERSKLARAFYVTAGSLALGLAALGLFLPLLPTTPFLLVAAACYIRGSRRLNDWLLSHPLFGKLIRNYRTHRGIPLRVKVGSITLLWIVIGISAVWVVSHLALRILLLVIALGVTVHLLRLKTVEFSEGDDGDGNVDSSERAP